MSKHTQGPLVVGRGATVYGADGYEIADAAQGPHLHASYTGADGHWASTPNAHIERDEDEELANANLIAAAPDLLEALRGLATLEEENLRGGDTIDVCFELAQARAAIAKAEGVRNA